MTSESRKKVIDPAVGRRIRELRQSQGLSLNELGTLSDVAWNHIAKIERGETEPGITLALKLVKALGCTLNDLTAEPAAA